MAIVHYLLVYDLHQQKLIREEPFRDSRQAVAAYEEAEREHLLDADVQIVLVGADSLDTIKVTHGHYFGDIDLSKYFVPIAGNGKKKGGRLTASGGKPS